MKSTEIDRLAAFEDWYWWHRARTAIVTSVLRRTLPSRTNRILDVGCGTGATSLALREFGHVLGVDAQVAAASAANARGLQVAAMDACHLGFRSEHFDLAVALDVLEHIADDEAAAAELRRVLRVGGLLLISVPAYQWLWSRHDVALGHVRRYTRSGLVDVLQRSGFSVELASYAMGLALPPAAALRLIERVLPHRAAADGSGASGAGTQAGAQSGYVLLPSFANSALSRLVALDRHLLQRVPIPAGLSVIALARKV